MSNIVKDSVEFMLKYAKDANWGVVKKAMQILSDNKPYGLYFNETDQTRDYAEGNARWVATLSDGSRVYSHDHHESPYEDSCWTRLKAYCEDKELWVTDMYIHFRSNVITFNSDNDGYFFRRSVLGSFGTEENYHYMIVGLLKNNKLCTYKYSVPAMLLETVEMREIEGHENSLIRKP